MFNNIGGKIKTAAAVTCILGMIASVIWGIILFSRSFLIGLLVMGLGGLFSWLGTFTLYGFGELIEETRRNREINQQLLAALKPQEPPVQTESAKCAASVGSYAIPGAKNATGSAADAWTCKHCGTRNPKTSLFCRDCGEYK